MYLDKLVNIDNITIRQEVLETPFVCDLQNCKGACCTLESQYGAPVKKEEIKIIDEILPQVLPYISERNREEINLNGFWEEKDETLMIRSVDNKDCVFSYYEDGVAHCGIEKCFYDGKIDFKKPISCHLFPIRITYFGGDVLRYEEFKECKPALENGKKLNVTVAEFCKESLTRLYGKEWYEKLSGFIRSKLC